MKAAFYKGTRPGLHGLYNRFVRWWTRGNYSHIEVMFSDGMSGSSSFLDGGVRFKKIDFDPANWDFIDLPDELESASRAWFTTHEGKAYDYWMNLRFCFGFMPESKDKYACSESCMASLGFTDAWRFEPNVMASALGRSNVRTL
jgi:hypothetical protein